MSKPIYQDKTGPWSSHTYILERLQTLPPGSRVLDVGTATGMLARRNGSVSLRFFGIEANPEWAGMAQQYYEKMWTCRLDEVPEDALGGYDAIVLGDVLEHLTGPEAVLKKLAGQQLGGSRFIISVPNVANLWIRLNLMFGRFDYTERGILDRTHLHFFTRKSLSDMTEQAGLEIVSFKALPAPLDLIFPFFRQFPGKQIYAGITWFTSLLPTLLGYQFVLEAKKLCK
jgi:2-polyprenyl-3-methyl-5-hydroxy-6-metoxy-1,4-benzoquinol methylase